jgi:pyrroloquinoline-quinone synthase
VAAVYAYEAQIPRVARAKLDGLRGRYGITDSRALAFFDVHAELDLEHSAAERAIVAGAPREDAEDILEATAEALDAWWDFLTAVDVSVEPAA